MSILRGFLTRGAHAVSSGNKLEQLLNDVYAPFHVTNLDKCTPPLKTQVFFTDTGDTILLEDENVARAVRASAALPVLFKPAPIGNRSAIDGGWLMDHGGPQALEAGSRTLVSRLGTDIRATSWWQRLLLARLTADTAVAWNNEHRTVVIPLKSAITYHSMWSVLRGTPAGRRALMDAIIDNQACMLTWLFTEQPPAPTKTV